MEIDIQNLTLNLGGNTILDNVNLNIESGTIHCIIGPNGAGKSSLVKSILSLLPYEGTIKIKYDKTKVIAYVPQKIEFDKTLPITVENFLSIIYQKKPCFFGMSKDIKENVENILIKIGMYEKKDRLLGMLSGGELQRVLLAQSLYPKPDLLILDEPFTGIDMLCEECFFKLMKELKESGTTIIWIHHNINQVIGIADKVTCLNKKIIFSDYPDEEKIKEKIYDIFI